MTNDPAAALAVVDELLLGPDSIPVRLRAREGLDPQKYAALVEALQILVEHYRGKTEVPKPLALAFVDISNFFYYSEDAYPPKVLERLEDAAHELTQLANQLFS
ncbi:MAG TPA: hypothetical protein VFZ61_07380 [Polyangiales bacterium]